MTLSFSAKPYFASFCLSKITSIAVLINLPICAIALATPKASAQSIYIPVPAPENAIPASVTTPGYTTVPETIPSQIPIPSRSPVLPQTSIAPEVVFLRQAIIGQESSANFRAVNRHSGALGYAQIMPSNLPRWSREALGYPVSRAQFLARPDLQIAIVDYKLNQYWQRSMLASNGDPAIAIQRVASWWYSGKPERYTSTQTQFYNGYRYPSIAAYSQSVLRRYQQLLVNAQNAQIQSPIEVPQEGGI